MQEQQKTGIKTADEMIETARAAGLTVEIETDERETSTLVRVQFGHVVPECAKGTALGQYIENERISTAWYKGTRKGSRWSMLTATRYRLGGHSALRRVKDVWAQLRSMEGDAAAYRRRQAERDTEQQAAVSAAEDVTTMFAPGERVRVVPQHWDSFNRVYVAQPEFIGTVVRYHRNGQYIVREPEHGTTCHYSATGKAVELFALDAAEEQQAAVSVPVATPLVAQCEMHSCGGCPVECCAPVEVFTATKGGAGALVSACRDCVRVHGLTPTDGWSYGAQVLPGGESVVATFRQALYPDPFDSSVREDWLTLTRLGEVEPFERHTASAVEGWAADGMLSAHGWRAVGTWEPTERLRTYRVAVEAVSAPVSADEQSGGELVPVAHGGALVVAPGVVSGLVADERRAAVEAEALVPAGERFVVRTVRGLSACESTEDRAFVVGVVASLLRGRARSSVSAGELVLRSDGETTVVRAVREVVPLGG